MLLIKRDRLEKAHVDAYDRKGPKGQTIHVDAYENKVPAAHEEPDKGLTHAERLYQHARGLRSFTQAITDPQKGRVQLTPEGGEQKTARPQFRPQPGRAPKPIKDPFEEGAKQTPRVVSAGYGVLRGGGTIGQAMKIYNDTTEVQRRTFEVWLARVKHPLATEEGTPAERYRSFLEGLNERREQFDATHGKLDKKDTTPPAEKYPEPEKPAEAKQAEVETQAHAGAADRAALMTKLDASPDGARFIVPEAPKGSGLAGTWEKTTVAGEHYWKKGATYLRTDAFMSNDRVRELISKQAEEGLQVGKGKRVGVKADRSVLSMEPQERKKEEATSEQLTTKSFTIPAEHMGADADTFTEGGRTVKVKYALVDAHEPIASHDEQFRANPDFPKELQPRDRKRTDSERQIQKIIATFNPALLGSNPKASDGAPVIGKDGAVEIGNGRTIALRRIYQKNPDLGDKYKSWLADNAKDFGLDADHVKSLAHPMLVRVRQTNLDRVAFTKETNKEGAARYSPAEDARGDAAFLTPDNLATFNPEEDINSTENLPFVRSFMRNLASTESGELVNAKGHLNPKGYLRIRNALLERAYQHPDLLERLTEGTDDNIRNVSQSLVSVAPRIASMKAGIEAGALHPSLDLSKDIGEAAAVFSEIRAGGMSTADYLSQGELDKPQLSANGRTLLSLFDAYAKKPTKIKEVLNNYVSFVESAGDPRSASMFAGGPTPQAGEALAYAQAMTEGNEKVQMKKEALFGHAQAGGPMGEDDKTLHRTVSQTNEPMYAESKSGTKVKLQVMPIGRTHPSGKSLVTEDGNEIANSAVHRITTASGKELWSRGGTKTEEPPKGESTQSTRKPWEMTKEEFGKNSFETEKGSVYHVGSDGTTTRLKAPHAEHPGDEGLKEKSHKTVYVGKDFAGEVGMFNGANAQKKRLMLREGKVHLLSHNEKAGKMGKERIEHDNTYSESPKPGLSPLELWNSDDNGYFRGNHPGNAITKMGSPDAHEKFVNQAKKEGKVNKEEDTQTMGMFRSFSLRNFLPLRKTRNVDLAA